MSKERVFSLKIAHNGDCAVKEQCNKHLTGDQARLKVLYALDTELRIVEPHLYVDGFFVPAGHKARNKGVSLEDFLSECKRTNQGIYYPLPKLTYVCLHNIHEDRGRAVRNTVSLYIPSNIKKREDGSIEGLICSDISTAVPFQTRAVLAEKYLAFARSRF